jgi:hypothetical protein
LEELLLFLKRRAKSKPSMSMGGESSNQLEEPVVIEK